MADPTASELMRRMDEIVQRLDRLTDNLDQGFVRKDVYASDRAADAIQVKGIEDEQHAITKRIDKTEERLTAHFRILLASLIYPLIVGTVIYLIVGAAIQS